MGNKEITAFFNYPDSRATAVYYLNCLNHLTNLNLVTKELDDKTTSDIQLFIEYPNCYEDIDSFFKKRIASKKVFYSIDPCLTFDTVKDYYTKYDLDHIFTTQKRFVTAFKDHGVDKVSWLPVAAHQMHILKSVPRPKQVQPVYDVAFVGTLFDTPHQKERRELLTKLYHQFNVNPVHLMIPEEIGLLYRTAKIGFNRSIKGDLNMRTFEILASGRLLVTDKQDGIHQLFNKGEHLVTYTNDEVCPEIIKHYLENDVEREEIAKKGYEELINKHLYIHRAKELLKVLE